MNPYDEELKAGDRLTFTDELELHLDDLGIDHNFDYGDELIVLSRDDSRKFKVQIGDPRDRSWQAWIFLAYRCPVEGNWSRSGFAPTERFRARQSSNRRHSGCRCPDST